jgi:hypothetical protein
MNETYSQLWRSLQLHSPPLPTTLAQQFINSRFRDIRRKRLWSWRLGNGQIITPNAYTTGLASATIGSTAITGSVDGNGNLPAWTSALVGLQFRFGSTAPIYTVAQVNSPTSLIIDLPFGGVQSVAPAGYQIFMGYITPPADFQDFISFKDVLNNYRVQLHVSQEFLDSIDSQRATSGNAYCVADFRYTSSPTLGSVSAAAVAVGSNLDPSPVTSGTYMGRTDSIFVFTVTTGGPTGTALFSWSKDNGTVQPNTPTTAQAFLLQEGVNIQWPVAPTGSPAINYVQGDVFVCKVRPGYALTIPQYELWPYNMSARVYPFLYDRRFPDLNDPTGLVPPFIDPDVLVKGALADVCRWKGTVGQANPMYGLDIAMSFEKEFQAKVAEMEREDDEVYCVDTRYQMESFSLLEYAPFPYGANWAQNHAVGAI